MSQATGLQDVNQPLKFKIHLNEDDHLNFQLYTHSKNEGIRKKQKKQRWIIPIFYSALILSLGYSKGFAATVPLVLILVLWILFYPKYLKNHYKKQFAAHVQNQIKDDLRETVIEIDSELIKEKDDVCESSYQLHGIKEINETGNYYFIKVLHGQTIIIPKNFLPIENDFRLRIKQIVKRFGIKHNVDLDWKWS